MEGGHCVRASLSGAQRPSFVQSYEHEMSETRGGGGGYLWARQRWGTFRTAPEQRWHGIDSFRLVQARAADRLDQPEPQWITIGLNWLICPPLPPIGPSQRGSGYLPLWIRDGRATGGEPARRGLRRVMGGRGTGGLLATRRTEGATGLRRRERCRGQGERRRREQAGFLNIGGAKIACAGYGQGGTTAASKFSGPGSAVPVFALHSRPYACRLPLSCSTS